MVLLILGLLVAVVMGEPFLPVHQHGKLPPCLVQGRTYCTEIKQYPE